MSTSENYYLLISFISHKLYGGYSYIVTTSFIQNVDMKM